MKSVLTAIIATLLAGVTAHADIHIKPPARGPVDTTIGTNPPKRGPIPGRPSIGEFERKQKITRFITGIVKKAGLDVAMAEQPNDLRNLIKVLVQAYRTNNDAADIINEMDLQTLPRGRKAREEVQFDLQMTLTMLAGEFGYQEQDN